MQGPGDCRIYNQFFHAPVDHYHLTRYTQYIGRRTAHADF